MRHPDRARPSGIGTGAISKEAPPKILNDARRASICSACSLIFLPLEPAHDICPACFGKGIRAASHFDFRSRRATP